MRAIVTLSLKATYLLTYKGVFTVCTGFQFIDRKYESLLCKYVIRNSFSIGATNKSHKAYFFTYTYMNLDRYI